MNVGLEVFNAWFNGGNVTSVWWQVTLCDRIWHVSSRSGAVLIAQTAIRFLTLPYGRGPTLSKGPPNGTMHSGA